MFKTTWKTKVAFALALAAALASTTEAQTAPKALTATLTDYVEMPLTARDSRSQPARINFLIEEPGHNSLFVSDSSGPLYILDKKTHRSTVYLDFNGSANGKGLFPRFVADFSFASGLLGFTFDPDYARNGSRSRRLRTSGRLITSEQPTYSTQPVELHEQRSDVRVASPLQQHASG